MLLGRPCGPQRETVLPSPHENPRRYYSFVEALRDTPLIASRYFEIMQIVPAIEDGHEGYEERLPVLYHGEP
jgi:hypothetical protein